jgi:hypothetical protein
MVIRDRGVYIEIYSKSRRDQADRKNQNDKKRNFLRI